MLREALTPLGSSLVVAGTHRKVRVHVHVDNTPGLAIKAYIAAEGSAAIATINVGTLPEAESSSGGGGAGLWLLPLLGITALRRRKLAQGQ